MNPCIHRSIGRMALAVVCAALVGCGGGSSGNSATLPLAPVDPIPLTPITPIAPIAPVAPSTPSASTATEADPNAVVTTPTQTLDLRWGTKAAAYVLPTTNNVTARVSAETGLLIFSGLWGTQSAMLPIGLDEVAPLYKSTSLLQEAWITQDVKQAWSQGWTGAGVRIGVIDDFTADEASDFLSIPLETGCNRIGDIETCASYSAAVLRMTHGEQVAGIAGGRITQITGGLVENGESGADVESIRGFQAEAAGGVGRSVFAVEERDDGEDKAAVGELADVEDG